MSAISYCSTETAITGDCQKKLNCQPTYAGFIGVFDGHDGCECSAYCAKGLLPHIVAEQAHRCAPKKKSWSLSNDSATTALDFEFPNQDMEITFISAFQKAQQRFCNHMPPPTFEEICKHLPLKAERSKGFNPVNWLASGTPPKRGGSCACTMSVVSPSVCVVGERFLSAAIFSNFLPCT